MNDRFSNLVSKLRKRARLTNNELAWEASVPRSLIPGLQSGKRRVGECQARRIGEALRLHGGELERFIFNAINECTEKVLVASQPYPAELLNLLPRQLRLAGVEANDFQVREIVEEGEASEIILVLRDGTEARLQTRLDFKT